MSKKLKCFGFNENILKALSSKKILTCRGVLMYSPIELMYLLKTSLQTAKQILMDVSQAVAPKPSTVLNMYNSLRCKHLSTNLLQFDEITHGGLIRGAITEVGGPPGCGKTQFCFLMTVNQLIEDTSLCSSEASMTGNYWCSKGRSVIYIDTEGAFDIDRVMEMAMARYPEIINVKMIESFSKRIIIITETSLQELMEKLEKLEEVIIERKAGLLVLDSVAALFKREFNCQIKNNIFERNRLLTKMISIFKVLADNYNLSVVVTNQITTQFNDHKEFSKGTTEKPFHLVKDTKTKSNNKYPLYGNGQNLRKNVTFFGDFDVMMKNFNKELTEEITESHEDTKLTVALGLQWSHFITCKILVQYANVTGLKEMCLVKFPQSPVVKFMYTTEVSGIHLQGSPIYEDLNNNGTSVKTKTGIEI